MKRPGGFISLNSPVILGMSFLCFAFLLINLFTQGTVTYLMGVYYTSWTDPVMYLRLFTHILCHQDLPHFTGNFLLILAVGPLVEEKYGSGPVALMMLVTALITGLINVIFFRNILLVGASGIVFMLILLASFTNIQEGKLPLTVLLVGLLYIGNEVVNGLISQDDISQVTHIAGGLCGAGFGLLIHGGTIRKRI